MEWLSGNPIWAGVIGLLVITATAFIVDAKVKGRTWGQEASVWRGSKAAQTISADATAVVNAGKAEWTIGHTKLNQIIALLTANNAPVDLPPVGTVSFDQWDAILPFAGVPNPLVLDGNIIRSGTGAPITFKTTLAVAPATQATVTRTA